MGESKKHEASRRLEAVEIKRLVEGVAVDVLLKNAGAHFEDIEPAGPVLQETVPKSATLQEQLDALFARAPEAKRVFDVFCRDLARDIGLDPDAVVLEHDDKTWRVHTEQQLESRLRARDRARDEFASDARRLIDVVRASIVVESEEDLDTLVEHLNEQYVAEEEQEEDEPASTSESKKMCRGKWTDVMCMDGVMCFFTDATTCFVPDHPVVKESYYVPSCFGATSKKDDDDDDDEYYVREDNARVVRFKNRFKHPLPDGSREMRYHIVMALSDGSRFVCELRVLLKQLIEKKSAKPKVDEGASFRPFFKRGGADLVEKIAKNRDVSDIARILKDALNGTDEDELEALADLFKHLGELNIVAVIRRRLVELAHAEDSDDSSKLGARLNGLASVLHDLGSLEEAKPLYERAIAIGEKSRRNRPNLAARLNNLGGLLQAEGDLAGAKPMFERAIAITEKSLGSDHPNLAKGLNNLAALLQAEGNLRAAKPLYERAISIGDRRLNIDHPDQVTRLNNFALLLWQMGRIKEAIPYQERATKIREVRGETDLAVEYRGELDGLKAGRTYPYPDPYRTGF